MNIGRIVNYTADKVSTYGWNAGLRIAGREVIKGVGYHVGKHTGTPVYEKDWDLLILLDACRVDVLDGVSEEYDFLDGSVDSIQSRASASYTWLERNFVPEYESEMANTAYITGNPFAREYVGEDDFLRFEPLDESAYDEELGTIPPRAITDAAVEASRTDDPDRLVVHYMQPHFPSIPDPIDICDEPHHNVAIDCHRAGCISTERAWRAYESNLRHVLDEVELLLENVDAETAVVSSDHGEAFGEYRVYGHPSVPLSVLREVPWVETSATDTGSYVPERESDDEQETAVEDRLRSLGYRE